MKTEKTAKNNSAFFETASMFEENWVERQTVNSLRCHATGAGRGILVVPADMKCIGFTNRGFPSYNVAETVRAESHNALPCVCIESCEKE